MPTPPMNFPTSSPSNPSPLSSLFAERASKCAADQALKRASQQRAEAAQASAARAKAEARKRALLADPTSARAIQAKHAAEVAKELAKEKKRKQEVLDRIEANKVEKRERDRWERERRAQRKREEERAGAGGGGYDWDYEEGRAVNVRESRLVGGRGGGRWGGEWGY